MIYIQLIYIIGFLLTFITLHFFNEATNWFGGVFISIIWPAYFAWCIYSIKFKKCHQ